MDIEIRDNTILENIDIKIRDKIDMTIRDRMIITERYNIGRYKNQGPH